MCQIIYGRGQKPGALNVYDEESNTVSGDVRVDKPPDVDGVHAPKFGGDEESGIAHWIESHLDVFEDEDTSGRAAAFYNSPEERTKTGVWTRIWHRGKTLYALWVFVILVVLGLAVAVYLARRAWKKR